MLASNLRSAPKTPVSRCTAVCPTSWALDADRLSWSPIFSCDMRGNDKPNNKGPKGAGRSAGQAVERRASSAHHQRPGAGFYRTRSAPRHRLARSAKWVLDFVPDTAMPWSTLIMDKLYKLFSALLRPTTVTLAR